MSDLSKLRVADADREQAVEELREHALAGRLTAEELEERIGGAYRALTRADLDQLKVDLPVSSTTVARALGKPQTQLSRRPAARPPARRAGERPSCAGGSGRRPAAPRASPRSAPAHGSPPARTARS